ncbi:MAG TPA: ornithine carbamoyltransferase, partial [Burkholderiaceae bacterium]
LLSRLYDAVECQGMERAVVDRLALAARIPIYPGLATLDHPSAARAQALPGTASLEEKRGFVLQAMLLRSIT